MIFHAQPALPYLLLSRLAIVLFRKEDIQIVYDIHDLHEYERHPSVIKFIRYSLVRYFALRILERLCFLDRTVRKMTVSDGLAREMSKKYKCESPKVVRNIPSLHREAISEQPPFDNKHELMYFGSPDRTPLRLMRYLEKQALEIHLYGKDIKLQNIIEDAGLMEDPSRIKIFGRYSPDEMNFLKRYSYLILYRPEVNTTNYRYSLPNKLFQALSAGLSVLVSPNFSEMIELFANVPGAMEVIENDQDLPAAIERASEKRDPSFRSRVLKFMHHLREEARRVYLETITNAAQVRANV